MDSAARASVFTGLPALGEVAWGTHLCNFYRGEADLRDTLVPFFRAGLDRGEKCIWVAAQPFAAVAANEALLRVQPDLQQYLERGQLEILEPGSGYGRSGGFDGERTLAGWLEQEQRARAQGFAGLRLSGNTSWLERRDWRAFSVYEAQVHRAFHGRRILALCSYPLLRCRPEDIVEVLRNHSLALVRLGEQCEVIQSATAMLSSLSRSQRERSAAAARPAPSDHAVQFFAAAEFPADSIARFLREGVESGAVALVIATPEHRAALARCWNGALPERQPWMLDAAQTLDRFVGPAGADPERFENLLRQELAAHLAPGKRLRVYGEMLDLLQQQGRSDVALQLEGLWTEVLRKIATDLLCGYTIEHFAGACGVDEFRDVCDRHEQVRPSGAAGGVAGTAAVMPEAHARLCAELQLSRWTAQRETALRVQLEAERAELLEREQEARAELQRTAQRLSALQRVTSALSEAADPAEVAEVVVGEMARSVGAREAILAVPVDAGASLRLLGQVGLRADALEKFPVTAPLPVVVAYANRTDVWLPSRAAIDAGYPELREHAPGAIACLPLVVGSRCIGAVGFGFAGGQAFALEVRAFLHDLARQTAFALERAGLYEGARSAEAALRALDRRKDEFLAILGHELRNPLAPIATALEVMKLRGDDAFAREHAVIERQMSHVSRLVDDLLDVSRVTQGKLELRAETLELAAVLARAVELAGPLIEERRQHLIVDVPSGLQIDVDPTRFAQAISNLLMNAAKYMDPGGRIHVRGAREEELLVVSVKDHGIGIPPELLPQLFEPFVQLERTVEKSQGGLGLGLALVKSLVELHGGSVSAHSAGLGRGSEFVIRLPDGAAQLRRRRAAKPLRRGLALRSAARQRLLLVDDNPDAADGLAELLVSAGHDVVVAYNPATALERAAAARFDVAILDIGLPAMDGYELARRLRELAAGRPLRLFAVTGYGTESDRARAREAGFDQHWVKPVDCELLLRVLERPVLAATDD